MLENTYKHPTEETEAEAPKGSGRKSIFTFVDSVLNLNFLIDTKRPVNYIPYLLFTTLIGIFYIGNTHYAEKGHKKLIQLEREVGDLRTEYTTLKAEYMFFSKQSEVVKRAEKLGLQETTTPPMQIKVKK